MQGPTPKNDFCRIFSRSSVLHPLSLALNHVLDEEGELSHLCAERIVKIFYLFSQAENHVKEMVADRIVLKSTLRPFLGIYITGLIPLSLRKQEF